MNYYGLLIRRERLRRDWSQAGLCRGICTVSYLSKIEQGKASPSTEVVRLLLERLALHVDDEIEAEAESAAGTGYERLLSGDFEGLKQIAHSFDNDRYKATTVALSIELLYKYATDDWSPLDDEYESCMEPRELMLQRMLQGRYEEAVRLTPNAYPLQPWCFTVRKGRLPGRPGVAANRLRHGGAGGKGRSYARS